METEKIICPICLKEIITQKDKDYLENTDRCFDCDFRIHLEDMRAEHYRKINHKDSVDISKHPHI